MAHDNNAIYRSLSAELVKRERRQTNYWNTIKDLEATGQVDKPSYTSTQQKYKDETSKILDLRRQIRSLFKT